MVTVHDVAKLAGVSSATVSRAVNTPAVVSPETLDRITRAIAKLGYAPNRIARSLKARASDTVGVIIPDITNPFLVKIVKGVEKTLSAAGYTPILCDTEESSDKEERYLTDLMERRIDGVVLVPAMDSRAAVRILKKRGLPAVFVDRSISPDFDCVKSNNISGLSLLVSHLIQLGRTSIRMIGGPQATVVGRERNDAFRMLMDRYQLARDETSLVPGDFTIEGGYRLAVEMLKERPLPQAIISANNLMGIGALKAIREAGLKLPSDLDLVVFDELGDMGELLDPPLTFVRQPALEMGAQAATLLLERMRGNATRAPRSVIFEPVLVSR
jgi:DNA-binding LacI/PurR family transcriptional regulator